MRITNNFTLEEFYKSSTADKNHINNYPDAAAIKCITDLCTKILQPVRDRIGMPLTITSGYRCPKLNSLVGGSSSSQHRYGQAADIQCKDNAKLFNVIRSMMNEGKITFGQLIWEYGNDKQPDWVHVSLPYSKKNQMLRAVKSGAKTIYIKI